MRTRVRRGLLRGAKIGFGVGLCLAALYLVVGARGDEITEALAYSCVILGFPAVFAVAPALRWLGAATGIREYVALVVLTLPLNGALWGAIMGVIAVPPSPSGPEDGTRAGSERGAA